MPISHLVDSVWFEEKTVADLTRGIRARPDAMVYFLCNVGDADTQVVLLPEHSDLGYRPAVVVDVSSWRKAAAVIDWATDAGLLHADYQGIAPSQQPSGRRDLELVVGTHPHGDHIGGMPRFLHRYQHRIGEFWDPGYYHPTGSYHDTMRLIGANPAIEYSNPAAGYRKWWGEAAVTVVGPSIHLRNRYDTYGVDPNDASITLQIEAPVPKVIVRDDEGNRVVSGERNVLLLGGDAQTLSWSHALIDFPQLRTSDSVAARAIGAAQGGARDLLRAGVHKIAHHGSKHGINLELVERVRAGVTVVSSVRHGGSHGFPHGITQHVLREVVEPLARAGGSHDPVLDPNRGIFYTGDAMSSDNGGETPLGTIAIVMRAGKGEMWRLGDDTSDPLSLSDTDMARRLRTTISL